MLSGICHVASRLMDCFFALDSDLFPEFGLENMPSSRTFSVFHRSVIAQKLEGGGFKQEIVDLGPFQGAFSLTLNRPPRPVQDPGTLLLIDVDKLHKNSSDSLMSAAIQTSLVTKIEQIDHETVVFFGIPNLLGKSLEEKLKNRYTFIYHSQASTDFFEKEIGLLIVTKEEACPGTQSCFFSDKEQKAGFLILNTEEGVFVMAAFPEKITLRNQMLAQINQIIAKEHSESKKSISLTGAFGNVFETLEASLTQKWICKNSSEQKSNLRLYTYLSGSSQP